MSDFREFLGLLHDVEANPVLPFCRQTFFVWSDPGDDKELLAACPLTQAALKSGISLEDLTLSYFPSDRVVNHLKKKFGVLDDEIRFVWGQYDAGSSLKQIIGDLEAVVDDNS